MTHATTTLRTPVGTLTLAATASGLAAILWDNDSPRRVRLPPQSVPGSHAILAETERQLDAYFAGTLREFSLPLDAAGTPFQTAVWAALVMIPFGETRSYGAIARQIGQPTAVRAVGAANGRNPISIVVPCHRVVGASGALTGFAGGLDVKERLLHHERAAAVPPRQLDLASVWTAPGHSYGAVVTSSRR